MCVRIVFMQKFAHRVKLVKDSAFYPVKPMWTGRAVADCGGDHYIID